MIFKSHNAGELLYCPVRIEKSKWLDIVLMSDGGLKLCFFGTYPSFHYDLEVMKNDYERD